MIDTIRAVRPAGIITGLLGPSGCGKTTLMRAIVGAQRITARLDHGVRRGRRRTQPASAHRLRDAVAEHLPRPQHGRERPLLRRDVRRRPDRVREVIDAVGLSAKRFEPAGNLSGGQKGRVSLACALVCDPDLLILDEPTVGLDPVLRAELWEQFRALADRGKTLLVSSHAMDEARHCTELILMRDGAILAHASPGRHHAPNRLRGSGSGVHIAGPRRRPIPEAVS